MGYLRVYFASHFLTTLEGKNKVESVIFDKTAAEEPREAWCSSKHTCLSGEPNQTRTHITSYMIVTSAKIALTPQGKVSIQQEFNIDDRLLESYSEGEFEDESPAGSC